MTVALSSQKLKQWIGNAIDGFRSSDLMGVPEPWLQIYEALATYISSGTPLDQKLAWMLEGTDDTPADVIYQLQRLKTALVNEMKHEDAMEELTAVLGWFDQTIVSLVERSSGKISEERGFSVPYETVFWKARDGMYISSIEGKFIHVNQALMDMLKYESMEDLLTMDIRSDLYEDREKREIMLEHLLEDGFFDHHEFRFRCKDGEVKSAIESCYLIDLPNGRQFIVGIMVDVTREKELEIKTEAYVKSIENKRMEAHFSLRQVARRFDALQKVNDHPVVVVEPKTFRFINYNPAFVKRFKYGRKHLEQMTFRDLFDRSDWMEIFTQISGGTHRVQYHIPNVTCTNFEDKSFPADLSIVIHQDDLGAALFVQLEDRTEVMQLEEQLGRVEENHKLILEEMPLGVIGFKADGSVSFVNKFLARRMGYRTYQLKNLAFVNKLFSQDEFRLKFNKYIRRFLRGQHAEYLDLELKTKTGEVVPFLLSTISWNYGSEDEPGFLALLSDMSHSETLAERRLHLDPEQLEDYQEKLQRLRRLEDAHNELLGKAVFRQDFLKTVAKKFKDPIHVVLGFASLLRKDLSDIISNSQKEDMDIIEEHISQVLVMLEKAVEYAQLEDGEVQFIPEIVGVRAALDDLFDRLTPTSMGTRKLFRAEHQILSVDLHIKTDLHLLESLMRHVVDNAIRYTGSGSVELTAYEDDNGLVIEIRDTGCGIEAGDLEHVLEPFYQGIPAENVDQQGLGLGLAIAGKYAGLIGAEIDIISEPAQGTRVLIGLGQPISD